MWVPNLSNICTPPSIPFMWVPWDCLLVLIPLFIPNLTCTPNMICTPSSLRLPGVALYCLYYPVCPYINLHPKCSCPYPSMLNQNASLHFLAISLPGTCSFTCHCSVSVPSLLFCFPPGVPCITDCVMAELEKLGQKYRVALRSVIDLYF